jgi:hypothetical protein
MKRIEKRPMEIDKNGGIIDSDVMEMQNLLDYKGQLISSEISDSLLYRLLHGRFSYPFSNPGRHSYVVCPGLNYVVLSGRRKKQIKKSLERSSTYNVVMNQKI